MLMPVSIVGLVAAAILCSQHALGLKIGGFSLLLIVFVNELLRAVLVRTANTGGEYTIPAVPSARQIPNPLVPPSEDAR